MRPVRAQGLLQGRLGPNAQDVIAMAGPVLSHRMALTFAARARGENLAGLIAETVSRFDNVGAAA